MKKQIWRRKKCYENKNWRKKCYEKKIITLKKIGKCYEKKH